MPEHAARYHFHLLTTFIGSKKKLISISLGKDADEENPKVFSDESTIEEPYLSEGYIRRNYKNGPTSTIVSYVGYSFEPNKDELFPFPAYATQANPGLTQHRGY